uniref:Uncharacterized protein n=1 Tax=Setaria digitata TaxID=48799 RepID=A0A915PVP3_9BILA
MQKIYLINVFVVVLIAYIRTAELENTYIDSWDAEKDWTSHFEPCRSHFMFTFSPCDPNTKMLACCRRFSPFLLFILLVFSLTSIAAVLILMLCCICPPWRVLCECFLCCSWCAIDENGNFIHFAEEEDENPEEFDIRTEDAFTTTSMTGLYTYSLP